MTPFDYTPNRKRVQKKRTLCHMANSALAYVNAYVINYDIKYSSFLAKKQSFFTYRCFAIEYSKKHFSKPDFSEFFTKKISTMLIGR